MKKVIGRILTVVAVLALFGLVGYLDRDSRENLSGLPSSVIQQNVVARWAE